MGFTPFRGRDVDQVGMLVLQLQALKVELPASVSDGAARLLRLRTFLPNPHELAQRALAVDDAGMFQLMTDVGIAHALGGSGGPGESAMGTVRRALQELLADVLLEHADGILDQLRPEFDRAGELVHEAAALGITEHTTDRDIVKADNIEAMRDAWTAIPGLTAKLGEIAQARIALSRTTGAPPTPTMPSGGPHADLADNAIGAMFRPDAPRWREDFEQGWQTWIRLCRPEPVRLLSLADSAAAADGNPPTRRRRPILQLSGTKGGDA